MSTTQLALNRNGYRHSTQNPFVDPIYQVEVREGSETSLVILSLLTWRGVGVAKTLAARTPMAEAFATQLLEALAPKDAGPLVLQMPSFVRLVYRAEAPAELPEYADGLEFFDGGWSEMSTLDCTCQRLPADRFAWLRGRGPLEVARHDLPEWDAKVEKQLHRVVADFVKAGKVTVLQPQVERAYQPGR